MYIAGVVNSAEMIDPPNRACGTGTQHADPSHLQIFTGLCGAQECYRIKENTDHCPGFNESYSVVTVEYCEVTLHPCGENCCTNKTLILQPNSRIVDCSDSECEGNCTLTSCTVYIIIWNLFNACLQVAAAWICHQELRMFVVQLNLLQLQTQLICHQVIIKVCFLDALVHQQK